MKKICAITMARNDEFFLNKWIEYYGAQFGEENLYVFLDGEDQELPAKAGRANIEKCSKVFRVVAKDDKRRIEFISSKARELFGRYDLVIGCDADEFLVVDPQTGKSLASYLSEADIKYCLSGLGMDVGQRIGEEGNLSADKKFLRQRSYAYVCSRYTKPVVIARRGRWGSGFHRFKGHNFHIDPNLYLFHFGSSDARILNSRFADKDRIKAGWARHLKKRFRPIRLVSTKKARGENFLKAARITQTLLRPVYAMNKPSMAFWRLVVKIPERFKDVL
ncbi:MAG: glycosyltransferase family 2 protein [Bacteroidetes bacterium]|uniref:Glycosyltransferase family 2 protein n=1 Tax=Candidatus Enterocola intestinipullorum TaxID=2840783 RepID=A0A9D9HDZ8_9BACT|nr:glycosyltransferase family 2 protein [Candidatus Enterocola intestinipullorum]